MRNTSATYRSLITSSHAMCSRARLVPAGQTGTNPGPFKADGSPLYELPIESGDVRIDPSAEIRSSVDLSTIYDWPNDASPFHVYGDMELFVERGVEYGNGTREWVGLGYHRLDDIEQEDAPDGPIDIYAPDRMAQIIDSRLISPRQFAAGTTIRAMIQNLVLEVYPSAVISLEGFNPDVPIPASRIVERDRYAFLLDIAKAYGCTMFFDYDGRFRMKPVPDPRTETPVWSITSGRQGVLVKAKRSISRKSVFNAFVAEGEQLGDQPPVRGVAYDTNPLSRTRWGGPFGQVPKFYSSSFLQTSTQAEAAALAMLVRQTGIPYTISFGFVPNPALEALDLVKVQYSTRLGAEAHVLDVLEIPLTADRLMTASTRLQPRDEV